MLQAKEWVAEKVFEYEAKKEVNELTDGQGGDMMKEIEGLGGGNEGEEAGGSGQGENVEKEVSRPSQRYLICIAYCIPLLTCRIVAAIADHEGV